MFLNAVLQPSRSTLLKFGLFPVRSPLLGESLVIFFSSSYLDVSVRRVGSLSGDTSSKYRVVPFGNLRIKRLYAPTRSLSQLTTSFIASQRQGIHHAPFFALNVVFFKSPHVAACILQHNAALCSLIPPGGRKRANCFPNMSKNIGRQLLKGT